MSKIIFIIRLSLRSFYGSNKIFLAYSTAVVIFSCILLCCGDSNQDNDTSNIENDPRHIQLLQSLNNRVFRPAIEQFHQESQHLSATLNEWVVNPNKEIATIRDAWKTAILSWQKIELLQIGPAGISTVRIGGQDLRDQIYSFPLSLPCRVEQALLNKDFEAPEWIEQAEVNQQGLDAIETLIYGVESTNNHCPPQARMNRDGTWDQFIQDLSSADQARAEYASLLGATIETKAQQLKEAWTTKSTSFGTAFANGSQPFVGASSALNEVFAGLFYIDLIVKDLKVAGPAGLNEACQSACVDEVEHPLSGMSIHALIANIESFQLLLHGGEPDDTNAYGLLDLLVDEGASTLANDLDTQTKKVIETLAELKSPPMDIESMPLHILSDLAQNQPEKLLDIHDQIKGITDLLRTQFVTILNLKIPQEGAGDND